MFVGDIGPDVTVDDLREAFQEPDQPPADARIVMDPTSGRTKGYGFVTFPDSEAATRALSKNGEILKGRKMRVNWASTTKDAKSIPTQASVYAPPPDMYMLPPVRSEVQVQLSAMAQFDGLDVGWYMRLPADMQAGIIRVSQEAPGAKVVWVGNLEKGTNRTANILTWLIGRNGVGAIICSVWDCGGDYNGLTEWICIRFVPAPFWGWDLTCVAWCHI